MPIGDIASAVARADSLVGSFDRLVDANVARQAAGAKAYVHETDARGLRTGMREVTTTLGDLVPEGLRARLDALPAGGLDVDPDLRNLLALRGAVGELAAITDAVRGAGGLEAVHDVGGLAGSPSALRTIARNRLDEAVAHLGRAGEAIDVLRGEGRIREVDPAGGQLVARLELARQAARGVTLGGEGDWGAQLDGAIGMARGLPANAGVAGRSANAVAAGEVERTVAAATRDLARRRFDVTMPAPTVDAASIAPARSAELAPRVTQARGIDLPAATTALADLRGSVADLGPRLRRLADLTAESFYDPGGDARRAIAVPLLEGVRADINAVLKGPVVDDLPEAVVRPLADIRSGLAEVRSTGGDMWPRMTSYATLARRGDGLAELLGELTPQRLVDAGSDPSLNPASAQVAALAARTADIGRTRGSDVADVRAVTGQMHDVAAQLTTHLQGRTTVQLERHARDSAVLRSLVEDGAASLRGIRTRGGIDPVLDAGVASALSGDGLRYVTARDTNHLADYRASGLRDDLANLDELAARLEADAASGGRPPGQRIAAHRAAAEPLLAAAGTTRELAPRRLRVAANTLAASADGLRAIAGPRGTTPGFTSRARGMLVRRARADASALVRQAANASPPLPGRIHSDMRLLARTIDGLGINGKESAEEQFGSMATQLRRLANTIAALPEPPPLSSELVAASRRDLRSALATIDTLRPLSSDYLRISEAIPHWRDLTAHLDRTLASLPAEVPAGLRDPLTHRVDRFDDQVHAAASAYARDGLADEAYYPHQSLLGAIEGDVRMLHDVLDLFDDGPMAAAAGMPAAI